MAISILFNPKLEKNRALHDNAKMMALSKTFYKFQAP